MADYAQINGRADLTDVLLPDQVVNDIMQTAPQSSVMLTRARRATMSSKKYKQPVLATLPDAYWVDGDTGMKQTTKSTWKNIEMVAEELAVIVPIPDALVDDANIPLWATIRPLLSEAVGKKIDQACIFGTDKPSSWPEALVPAAKSAGNSVERGTGDDLGVDVAMLGEKIAKQGYGINGFAAMPGLQWQLMSLRDANKAPIYTQLPNTPNRGLYGYELNEVMNGAWDATQAELLAADWNMIIVGIRQDITFSLFSEGVISDDTGKVILNLMQQDTKALRVVMRVGYQVANPMTRLADRGSAYPAGVIVPKA